MTKLPLSRLDLKGKRVLLRVDFNVPQDKEGNIVDDTKILAALPTMKYILGEGASLVLMSHLGRPKYFDPLLSLSVLVPKLEELLERNVRFSSDSVGSEVEALAKGLRPGEVLLLENLRFHKGEEEPEKELGFVEGLAHLGNVYVNDAFGTAHRAHASTALLAKFFPKKGAMGFLLEKELQNLSPLLQAPHRPFFAILGGAKVSTKIGVLHHLLEEVDGLFVGGAMAFTFLRARGIEVGDSLWEERELPGIESLEQKKIFLPSDIVITREDEVRVVSVEEGIELGWRGVDIGPKTVQQWGEKLQRGATIFWNGPLGMWEDARFQEGTKGIAQALASVDAEKIVGGGDSVAAIRKMGLEKSFTYLSTGGGASLEFLEYGHLPGVDSLSEDDENPRI